METENSPNRDTPPCRHIASLQKSVSAAQNPALPDVSDVSRRLRLFDAQHTFSLRPFHPFDNSVCPPRLALNVYRQGCGYKCLFCYVWHGRRVRPDRRILRYLPKDIELAKKLGLAHLPVMVSCSTDPFQPLEKEHRQTEKVLGLLADAGLPLIVLTQNPAGILDGKYVDIIKSTDAVIEVSIASPHVGPNTKGIFYSLAPNAKERFRAVRELVKKGLDVRLRLDPIIPRIDDDGPGQSAEDIRWLVSKASAAGMSMVISKTMVLTPEIFPSVQQSLLPFYRKQKASTCTDDGVLVLDSATQQRLIEPVWAACRENGVKFCSCVSDVELPGCVSCRFPAVNPQHDAYKRNAG